MLSKAKEHQGKLPTRSQECRSLCQVMPSHANAPTGIIPWPGGKRHGTGHARDPAARPPKPPRLSLCLTFMLSGLAMHCASYARSHAAGTAVISQPNLQKEDPEQQRQHGEPVMCLRRGSAERGGSCSEVCWGACQHRKVEREAHSDLGRYLLPPASQDHSIPWLARRRGPAACHETAQCPPHDNLTDLDSIFTRPAALVYIIRRQAEPVDFLHECSSPPSNLCYVHWHPVPADAELVSGCTNCKTLQPSGNGKHFRDASMLLTDLDCMWITCRTK